MSIFFHASDLHFGRTDPQVADALLKEIYRIKPDMALLSGDFTQIGSRDEFKQARTFLDALPCPFMAVPGNHDIPARNLVRRFLHPYALYRKYINDALCPLYEDPHHFIVGINTARRIVPHWNWSHGKISRDQIRLIEDSFSRAQSTQWKILMCHHPLHALVDSPINVKVWRADLLRATLLKMNIHMVVTGHIHHGSVQFEEDDEVRLYHIGAASAFSTRLRTQGNGYNLIQTNDHQAKITLMTWNKHRFDAMEEHIIER